LLQGAWALLLHAYSGDPDVLFGTTVSGRPSYITGIEAIVGLFINSLPVRAKLEARQPLAEYLQEFQQRQQEMLQYAFTPLVTIQKCSKIPADCALFGTLLIFENYPIPTELWSEHTGFEVIGKRVFEKVNYGLILQAAASTHLQIDLWYDCAHFEVETMKRMGKQLRALLEDIVTDPQRRLSEVSLLSEAERQQVLVEWNRTEVEYVRTACVQELVEAQVDRIPDHLALSFGMQHISYAELNSRANRVAERLRQAGIGPEMQVVLWLDRSPALVLAALAVLKAGAAYVPLDPANPRDRVELMLEDSTAHLIITEERLEQPLRNTALMTITLDRDWPAIAAYPAGNQLSAATPQNLAYVIFTSGSTGKPKGVMVEHQHLMHALHGTNCEYEVNLSDRATQVATPAFDASAWEMWAHLTEGASLHILPSHRMVIPDVVIEWLLQEQITDSFLPTALAIAVSDSLMGDLPSLKRLFTGGENLKRAPIHDLPFDLINAYGPTETTILATHGKVDCMCEGPGSPSLGSPIANAQIYLLDSWLRPVSTGRVGEIYIGGAGVARGYLSKPRLTAERFVPNPFTSDPGDRLYRTGDLAFYSSDQRLQFLGRIDEQVKVRGYRIELGEIEAALYTHPSVAEAVVIVEELDTGDNSLVACVVPTASGLSALGIEHRHPGEALDSASDSDNSKILTEDCMRELQAQLSEAMMQKLPKYMCPSRIMTFSALPRTTNGKLDKARLLESVRLAAPHSTIRGARDIVEYELIQIWRDTLKTDAININDDFFDLGGHSLNAVQLVSKIYATFGETLDLSQVLELRTIQNIAKIVRRSTKSNISSKLIIPLQKKGSGLPFFCVHPGGGGVLCYARLARCMGEDQPWYAIQAVDLDEKDERYASVENIAKHYIEAITKIQPQGPYSLGGWSLGGRIAFEMARQLRLSNQQVRLVAIIDSPATLSSEDIAEAQCPDNAQLLVGVLGHVLDLSKEALNHLSDTDQLHYVLELARSRGQIPEEFGIEDASKMLGTYKTLMRASCSYTPPICPGTISLFRQRQSSTQLVDDPTLGWSKFANDVKVYTVPGDHLSMMENPANVEILAHRIKECMASAYANRP
jgi:amino acid adenylation domain-containing protein